MTPSPASDPEDTFDGIAHDLQELRLASGAPSYADIVVRISQDRRARGVDPARARPARSTVYDAFRPGRARINAALVGEIASALGDDDPEAWVRRCQRARRAVDRPKAAGRSRRAPEKRPSPPPEEPAPGAPATPEDHPSHPAPPASSAEPAQTDAPAPESGPTTGAGIAPAADSALAPAAMPPPDSAARASAPTDERAPGTGARDAADHSTGAQPGAEPARSPDSEGDAELDELATEPALAEPTARQRWSFLGLSVALNIAGTLLLKLVQLPLHLDMVGTGAAAILLGPWWGALVAVATTLLQTMINTTAQLPFGLVAVAGALIWGYGAQRFGMLRGIPRFMGLNLLVALACSAIAVPLILTVAPWGAFHSDFVNGELLKRVTDQGLALTVRNLTVSVTDKMMSGLIIAVILLSVSWAPPSRRPSLTERAHPTSPRPRSER